MSINKKSSSSNLTDGRKLKVLISAYACEPNKGSEPGVGWNWSTRLSKLCDVTVITRANNQDVIEQDPKSAAIKWIYLDGPPWMLRLKKGRMGVWLYYRIWQYMAYCAAKKVAHEIDVVHHLTFGTYWARTDMVRLNVPTIIGPVGGAELVPWSCILQKMSLKGVLYEIPRNVSILCRCISPWTRAYFRKVSIFVAKNKETAEMMKRLGGHVGGIHTEAAMSFEECEALKQLSHAKNNAGKGVFRILCIGELRALKGGHFFLAALKRVSELTDNEFECVFLGEGPERKRLTKMAVKLGLEQNVKLVGRVPRSEVLKYLEDADILMHPTLHDSGGWTCLEAMAAGVPVISLNVGGPAMQVSERCGILIDPKNPDYIINELTNVLDSYSANPEKLLPLKAACLDRVSSSYLWDQVVVDFIKYYQQAIANEDHSSS